MNQIGTLLVGVSIVALCAVGATAAEKQRNVLFVLDASNSMWGQIGGKPKIDIAKSVLKDLAKEMPGKVDMGLVSYGHRFDRKLKECDDMELMNPVGHFSYAEADNAFSFITPKGQTPIARTLQESVHWLADYKGQENTVVLISDGLESCDGDPCAAASALNAAGITTKIHVVGFDLNAEQQASLQCIAANGKGKMFAANDADDLKDALNEVKQAVIEAKPIVVAQTPTKKPEPPKDPVINTLFEENFDDEELAAGWSVQARDDDRFIVEEGEALFLSGPENSSPAEETIKNLALHDGAIPKGDWVMTARFTTQYSSGGETLHFGTYKDHENWMAIGLKAFSYRGLCKLTAFMTKTEKGEQRTLETIISETRAGVEDGTKNWGICGMGTAFENKPFSMSLHKQGREYRMTGTVGIEGEEGYQTFKTDPMKMLRSKPKLFVAAGFAQAYGAYDGDGAVMIDQIKITGKAK